MAHRAKVDAMLTYLTEFVHINTPVSDVFDWGGTQRPLKVKQCKKAFRSLACQVHPDKGGSHDPERAKEAFQVLSRAEEGAREGAEAPAQRQVQGEGEVRAAGRSGSRAPRGGALAATAARGRREARLGPRIFGALAGAPARPRRRREPATTQDPRQAEARQRRRQVQEMRWQAGIHQTGVGHVQANGNA